MFATATDVLLHNPHLFVFPLVYCVGLFVCQAKWSKCPTAALMCTTALGTMLVLSGVTLVRIAFNGEWLSSLVEVPQMLRLVLSGGATLLLVLSVFADRTNEELED